MSWLRLPFFTVCYPSTGYRHAVALGSRPIADTVEVGDLRFDGDPQAISGLTSLLQALTSSP